MSGNGRPGGPGDYRRMDEFNRRIKEAQQREASAKARQARRDAQRGNGGGGCLMILISLTVKLLAAVALLTACEPSAQQPQSVVEEANEIHNDDPGQDYQDGHSDGDGTPEDGESCGGINQVGC